MKVTSRTRATACLAGLLLCGISNALFAGTNSISLSLPIPALSVQKSAEGWASFGETDTVPTPGAPAVPQMTCRILLPPDVALAKVSVTLVEESHSAISGEWNVSPASPDIPGYSDLRDKSDTPVLKQDETIYLKDAYFPAGFITRIQPGRIREWRFVDVDVCLMRYNPVTKQLLRLDAATLRLAYTQTGSIPLKTRARATYLKYRSTMQRISLNFAQFASSYDELHK